MKKPIWLIEANVEGLPSEALQSEIRRQGMDVHIVKPFLHAARSRDILGAEQLPLDALAVFTGTLTLMRYIQQNRRWRPGGWCTFDNLACSVYYAHFGSHMLNRNYAFLPVAEALRRHDGLFSTFGRQDTVFVRPDSVDKSFSGKMVDRNAFVDLLRQNATDPTLLVMVSEPQPIRFEWRLFIQYGKVFASSQYRLNGQTNVASNVPVSVIDFAETVLEQITWRPASLFVIDVCDSNDELKIVELNSFSCSGQYAIDLQQYVSVASESAMVYA
jgi:hypothetical protein